MYLLLLGCALAATVLTAFWLLLFLRYRKRYNGILEKADPKIFTLKELYFIGLGLIESYERIKKKKITASEKAAETLSRYAEVFGRNQAELYYYISASASISLFLTFLPIGLTLPCLLKEPVGLLLGVVLAGVLAYGVRKSINSEIARKREEILDEFPNMVSKLTLLINAGMNPRPAWDVVAESDHSKKLYAEMRATTQDIREGMTIEAAMDAFASRCGLREIRKLSSIYVQAINKSASEALGSMKTMAEEAWVQKKQLSRQKGELASQKLLIPNMIMFIGIMVVVVVPMIAAMMGTFVS